MLFVFPRNFYSIIIRNTNARKERKKKVKKKEQLQKVNAIEIMKNRDERRKRRHIPFAMPPLDRVLSVAPELGWLAGGAVSSPSRATIAECRVLAHRRRVRRYGLCHDHSTGEDFEKRAPPTMPEHRRSAVRAGAPSRPANRGLAESHDDSIVRDAIDDDDERARSRGPRPLGS